MRRVIPEAYPLLMLAGAGYRQRTLQNVQDSDRTLILYTGQLSGGTKLTRDPCVREKKPFVVLDAAQIAAERVAAAVRRFIEEHAVSVLNVAGPRASGWAQGHSFAVDVIAKTIRGPSGRSED